MSPGIGTMNELVRFWVGHNKLSGAIPPELGSRSSLYRQDLHGNEFSSPMPPELGLLDALNVSHNQPSGKIPAQSSGVKHVKYSDFSHNKLPRSPGMLGVVKSLVILDVSYNDFSGNFTNTSFDTSPVRSSLGTRGSTIPPLLIS